MYILIKYMTSMRRGKYLKKIRYTLGKPLPSNLAYLGESQANQF